LEINYTTAFPMLERVELSNSALFSMKLDSENVNLELPVKTATPPFSASFSKIV
jgi:hypothetical protein